MEAIQDVLTKFQQLAEQAKQNPLPAAEQAGSIAPQTYECAICKDEGVVMVDNWTAKQCGCIERKRIAKMFKSSHITEQFAKLGFQNFQSEQRPRDVIQAKESALLYLKTFDHIREDRQNSIALLGKPGCGKTHLLMAVSNNLMRKGISVMYFPYVEGFNEIKDNLDQLDSRIQSMMKVDVLYIDDLYKGRKEPTPFVLEQLFAVINYRYVNHLPILVSSEKNIDEICAVDMGIGSRIYEMAKFYTVVIGITQAEMEAGIKLNYRLIA